MNANALMLIIARESRHLTQTELAKRMSVAQGTVSKAENGQVPAMPALVEKYAAALEYPVSFFYQEGEFRNLPVPFYRKRRSLTNGDIKAIRAKMNIIRGHVRNLVKAIDLTEVKVPSIDLKEYDDSPELIAKELRIMWHLPPGPIASMVDLLENAGVVIIKCDFGTNQVDGISFYEAVDDAPPVILVNPNIPGDRLRFTLAHELAHLVMHNHMSLAGQDCEPEADQFASELLMPSADVRGFLGHVTLDKLMSLKPYWKVSMQALLMRAGQLGYLSPRQKTYMWMQLSKAGFRTKEPDTVALEEPTLIGEIIRFHVDDLGYTDTELSAFLNLNCNEFHMYYPGVKRTLRLVPKVADVPGVPAAG
jgi:Zn-dependent peptidase ImmA (M78 family)/DNA-binding XRE family transcriptional regulator